MDFIRFFLEQLDFDLDHILFNSLAYSFLVSHSLAGRAGHDILFWQEPLYDELPGNMQLILENSQLRAQTIVIPDLATYEKAKSLAATDQQQKFLHLGYHYDFKRDNFLRKDALILTRSDQIEGLETFGSGLAADSFALQLSRKCRPSSCLCCPTRMSFFIKMPVSSKLSSSTWNQTSIWISITADRFCRQCARLLRTIS